MEKDVTRIYSFVPPVPFRQSPPGDSIPRIEYPESVVVDRGVISEACKRADILLSPGRRTPNSWEVYQPIDRSFKLIGEVPGSFTDYTGVAEAVEALVGRSALTIYVPPPFH